MRKIIVEIDANEKSCGCCEFQIYGCLCTAFGKKNTRHVELKRNSEGALMRHRKCINSEKRALAGGNGDG